MTRTTAETLDYQSRRPRPKKAHFWRATAYLRPYRRLVIISMLMALLAGGVLAGGITAVFPILQTLLHGDTPQMWVDRMIAEQRWGIDLADDPQQVRLLTRMPDIDVSWQTGYTPVWVDWPRVPDAAPAEQLRFLADATTAELASDSESDGVLVEGNLRFEQGAMALLKPDPVPWYLRLLRRIVYLLPSNPVGAIAAIMGFILVLAIVSGVIRFAQEYLSSKAALNAINDIRRDLYDHVLRVPMSYFGRRGTGDVTSRIVGDAAQLQAGFTTLLGPAVQQPILAFFALIVALFIDWRLTLFIVAFAPIMAVVLRRFGKKMKRVGTAALVNNAELLGQIDSTLAGIRVVKANVAEKHEAGRLKTILDRLLRFQLKMQKYDAASGPTIEVLGVAAVGVIVIVMVYLVRQEGSLSVAGALVIFGCLAQMADAMRRISKLNVVLQKSNAAAERIFETIDLPSELNASLPGRGGPAASPRAQRPERAVGGATGVLQDGHESNSALSTSIAAATSAPLPEGEALRAFSNTIAFDNVHFSYDPDAPPALAGISLTVRKGESLAIVGRNGSGKTTLLSLLPRFFDPDDGAVLIDGTDIRTASLESLRRQIGVVTQEAVVFPGTIAENIAYARPDAPRGEIEAAARQAEAHEFIIAKAQGYDTPLEGLGSGLSGGQRQRLNIARAILRDPPILILDEATSQVDAESEHLIQQAIRRLMQGRTVFVIAHRFSTILDCDRIALMEAGKLAAVGTHEELLEKSELYRQLYDRQLVGV